MRGAFALGLCLVLLAGAPAHAETRDANLTIRNFGAFYFFAEEPGTIHLGGDVVDQSLTHFLAALRASGQAQRVVLSSDGGNVLGALGVAREIERRGMDTFIPQSRACYSACSFIFLAGRAREAQGRLGVHQMASESDDFETGQTLLADVIEALDDFGTPIEVILRMLRTPHMDMDVISAEDIERLGLNRARFQP